MEQLPFNPFVNWGIRRIKKNKNLLVVINGPTGSGKTYAGIDFAIKLAKEAGTSFTVKDNLDFNFNKLLAKMNLPQNRKPGTPFLFEEVGAVGGGASSREWQSYANKLFFSFTQTSRHRNQILIMTCPNFKFLEYGARTLVHLQMSMKRIEYANKKSICNPFILQTNTITGKIYFKRLRLTYKGSRYKVSEVSFDCPDINIIKEYERMKTIYTSSLNKQIIDSKEGKKAANGREFVDLEVVQELLKRGYSVSKTAKTMGKKYNTIFKCYEKIANGEKVMKNGLKMPNTYAHGVV